MLIWTTTIFVEHFVLLSDKIPYFISFVPHLRPNDGGGAYIIRTLIKYWFFDNKLHIIVDSKFGSFSLLAEITQWSGTTTIFLPFNECQKLNLLFAYNFSVNYFRICIKNSIIFQFNTK
jgi:hypothetical protein